MIDYERLWRSYDTEDMLYAKIVLYDLHEAARQFYGERLSCHGDLEFAVLPGVLQSKSTGKLCIGLFGIDLYSSGEHCSTFFLTRHGAVAQGDENESKEILHELSQIYGPYDYRYTIPVGGDIHVREEEAPEKMKRFLDSFQTDAEAELDRIIDTMTEQSEELEP